MSDDNIPVIINPDGSVYPFIEIFNPENESEDELYNLIKTHLEASGRKIGTFYRKVRDEQPV